MISPRIVDWGKYDLDQIVHMSVPNHMRDCIITHHEPNRQTGFDPSTSLLNPRMVDYKGLRSRITECVVDHNEECGVRLENLAKPIQRFRLIHCASRSIVPAEESCDYVALSYVWGRNSQDVPIQSNTQPKFPATIEDAIHVTLQLGFTYLWVDRYCIEQSDSIHKTEQIQQMGQVYYQASLTIIAAAGTDPSYGLPGVSRARVFDIDNVVTPDYTVVPVPYDPSQYIQDSIWSTRGWTYQEEYLSRRRIFFTDVQIYFECLKVGRQEIAFDKSLYFEEAPKIHRAFPRADDDNKENILSCICQYSSREVGYVYDRMRAFLGVLASAGAPPTPVYHLWGVPLKRHEPYHGRYTFYLGALIVDPSERRREFPSWSWLGWSGSVRLNFAVARELHRHDDVGIRYSVQVEEGGDLVDISPISLQRYYSTGSIPEDVPRVLRVSGMTFPLHTMDDVIARSGFQIWRRRDWEHVYKRSGMEYYETTIHHAGSGYSQWVCWQNEDGLRVYAKYWAANELLEDSVERDQFGQRREAANKHDDGRHDELGPVELRGVLLMTHRDRITCAILRAVGGGYETAGYLVYPETYQHVLIEVSAEEDWGSREPGTEYLPRISEETVRWL
ncbi:Heterokaryon incompatibility protein (HET)-containing protein [Apiospora sp. TS-2023a]